MHLKSHHKFVVLFTSAALLVTGTAPASAQKQLNGPRPAQQHSIGGAGTKYGRLHLGRLHLGRLHLGRAVAR